MSHRVFVASIVSLSVASFLVACVGDDSTQPVSPIDASVPKGDASIAFDAASGDGASTIDGPSSSNDAGSDASNPAPGIYVTSFATNSVAVFALDASGDAGPVRTLAGNATTLSGPIGVGVDTGGNLYVANRTGGNVTVYAPLAEGDASPTRTLVATSMSSPEGLVVGPTGDLYVSTCPSCGGGSGDTAVFHFPSGAATSDRELGGASNTRTALSAPGNLALDGTGNLYVGNSYGGTVEAFPTTASGDVAPTSTFTPQSSNLQGMTVGEGAVLVADPSSGIEQYPATATGSPAPTSTLDASALPVQYPAEIFLDTRVSPATLYVVDYGASAIFVVHTSGTAPNLAVSSVTTIQGPGTTLSSPVGIAVVR